MIKPEGVAAPLEPTRPIDIALVTIRDFPVCIVGEKFRDKLLERFLDMRDALIEARRAAAVSKNLQEELAKAHLALGKMAECFHEENHTLQASVDQLCGDVRAIQQDYTDERKLRVKLEKEITALREKPIK